MIEYNQLFYGIFAIIAFGLGISSIIGFKDQKNYFKTKVYWTVSIYLFMLSCLFWAIAPLTSYYLLTLANTCLVAAMVAKIFLFRSFTQAITKAQLISALLLLIVYFIAFEQIRQTDFKNRVLMTSMLLMVTNIVQLQALTALIKIDKSIYLKFNSTLSILMVGILINRIYTCIYHPNNLSIDIYHETALPLYGRMIGYTMFVLNYIFIGHYFYEKAWQKANQTIDLKEVQVNDLKELAYYDNLTSLPNRLLFMDRLEQAMARVNRERGYLAVLFIDLDGFKQINDNHGHDIGDKVLITVSQRMKAALRKTDTVARLGGDEFIVLLTELSEHDIGKIPVTHLLQACSAAINVETLTLNVSASIGVSLYGRHASYQDTNISTLIEQADQAMYVAKQAGKNRYHYFES
ncbi:MAG: diguanylate cyclase [Methylococcales bacterium]|nr:MAG: diguanylate cyclase [Methylococcales bacterium]